MPQEPLPDWFYPGPPGGWVADDLDRLPSSPRLELIDGSLIVMSPLWRVEDDDGTAVHAYELDDTTGAYVATGIHRDKLKVSVPFPMEIDLTTLFGR